MSIPSADRRDRENVDAFLCGLKASAYQAPLSGGENVRSEGADSQILTGSQSLPIDASGCRETSKSQILTVSPDCAEQVITEMVEELAEDIDFAIGYGSNLRFTGAELRQHYADLVREKPVEAVLDDVQRRWMAQVNCDVLPLEFQDPEPAVIEDDVTIPRAGTEGGG